MRPVRAWLEWSASNDARADRPCRTAITAPIHVIVRIVFYVFMSARGRVYISRAHLLNFRLFHDVNSRIRPCFSETFEIHKVFRANVRLTICFVVNPHTNLSDRTRIYPVLIPVVLFYALVTRDIGHEFRHFPSGPGRLRAPGHRSDQGRPERGRRRSCPNRGGRGRLHSGPKVRR